MFRSVAFIAFVLVLDNTVRGTFSDKQWSVPSTVYARPLELYIGAPLKAQDLRLELQQLGYHFVDSINGPTTSGLLEIMR